MTDMPLESVMTYLIAEKARTLIFYLFHNVFLPIFCYVGIENTQKVITLYSYKVFCIVEFTKIQFHVCKEQSS
jgi:hypothetical protein